MAANMQKIKLLKLYELLRKETDESHPISRVELCRRLNEMGISSNVRTLSLDIEVMQDNGFRTVAAADFVGEHSFSTVLGAGRPDAEDMEQVRAFAELSAQKLDMLARFKEQTEAVLGQGSCHVVTIRPEGGVRLA